MIKIKDLILAVLMVILMAGFLFSVNCMVKFWYTSCRLKFQQLTACGIQLSFNALRPEKWLMCCGQNFQYIFLKANFVISIGLSQNCVLKGPINSNSALVQVMAWCRTGNNLLHETVMSYFFDSLWPGHNALMSVQQLFVEEVAKTVLFIPF